MSRRQSWNTILVFCILIFGMTVATILKPSTEFSETENRSLAQKPSLSVKPLLNGEFESDYESYLTDQFVLRDQWIALKTKAERATFKTESKDIYFADDDYLIEKHTGSFTSDMAQQNIRILQQFVETYEPQFGAEHMSVMIVPNAVDILRDKLPAFAAPYDEETYLNQAAEVMPSGVWFDASSVLRSHLDEELYYHTDHHWKTGAAFTVYQEWAATKDLTVPSEEDYQIETATDSFEGTIQSKLGIHTVKDSIELYQPIDDLFYTVQMDGSDEVSYSIYDRTALDTKNKYGVYFGGNHALVKLRTRNTNGRKMLVIKDSYAHCFAPFLLPDFAEVDLLDIRYYNQKVSDLIAQGGYTDFLFLYNAAGFAEDTSIARIIG
ncbi:MAG: DHHW family protein [Lachnospiraceae bacterium]|nr:DHHW family protein [Lachnospiraceae bacterium]